MKPGDERGFIHKKILGVAKRALGVGSSFLPGPLGTVARTISSFGGSGVSRVSPSSIINQRGLPRGSRTQIPTPGFAGRVQRFLPGGASGFTTLPPGLIPKGPGGIIGTFPGVPGGVTGFGNGAEGSVCPPRGMHLNKSSYFLRDGTFVEKGTRFVANRKRNASNGRANDLAIRRLDGAETQAKKVLKKTGWRTISKQSSREIRSAKKVSCK